MLKEFIAHIQKTTQPIIQEINGSTFAINGDGNARELRPTIDRPDTLSLHSLEALVTMVQTEAANMGRPLYITIPSHQTVRCFDSRTLVLVISVRSTTKPRPPMFRGSRMDSGILRRPLSNCGVSSPPVKVWITCWISFPASARRAL